MIEHMQDEGEEHGGSAIVGCLFAFAAFVVVGGLGWLVFWLVGLV